MQYIYKVRKQLPHRDCCVTVEGGGQSRKERRMQSTPAAEHSAGE